MQPEAAATSTRPEVFGCLRFLCFPSFQGDLVKGLTSSDSHTSSEAIAKADEYLERSRKEKEKEEERKGGREAGGAADMVVQDRTVINRGQESSTPSNESRELRLASQV